MTLSEMLAAIIGACLYAFIDYLDERRTRRPADEVVYEASLLPLSLNDTAPRFAAMAMWLQGYGVLDISSELQCTEDAVLTALCIDGYVLNNRPWDEP